MNALGLQQEADAQMMDSDLEEGQIRDGDSPFSVMVEADDDFGVQESITTTDNFNQQQFEPDTGDGASSLDYEDDMENENGEEQNDKQDGGSSVHDLGRPLPQSSDDIADDPYWEQQQQIIRDNREKREKARKRLERQKQLAEEKLREEREKEELERMERDIRQLHQQRSVLASLEQNNEQHRMGCVNKSGKISDIVRMGRNGAKVKPVKAKVSGNARMQGKQTDWFPIKRVNNVSALTNEEQVRRWLQASTTDSGGSEELDELISQLGRDNECSVSCFSRRAVRDQQRAVTQAQLAQVEEAIQHKKQAVMGAPLRRVEKAVSVRSSPDRESDGESVQSCRSETTVMTTNTKRGGKLLKSGFLDKPRSSVMVKHKWPHMNQDTRYVTEPLSFNELNFCQFVGGECRTILRTQDPTEHEG